MTTYIALLRAVNVGGTGKLPMAQLRAMCVEAGFKDVTTYIASGNVVFSTTKSAASIKKDLEKRLLEYAGKPVAVMVRTAKEMAAVLDANPFPTEDPKHTYAIFLDKPPVVEAIEGATGRNDEQLRLGKREIYVYYPSGMGQSKLKIPAAKEGTARNMNTLKALIEICNRS